jgi:hypothetical protein
VSALSGSTPKKPAPERSKVEAAKLFVPFLASLALSLHLREHADVTTLSHAHHHHHHMSNHPVNPSHR